MVQARVSIVMGSASDWPMMQEAAELLDQFEIAYEVAIGAAGAANAGILTAQMIALGDAQVAARLRPYKTDLAVRVECDSEALQQQLSQGHA